MRSQQTLRRTAAVSGFGYWSGSDVRVEFRPAPPDHGVVFVRGDMFPARRIAVTPENRREVPRRTVLSDQGASVEMVEHILAALAGLQIDNCEVWVDAPEMPGCDGSSLDYVRELAAAGIARQTAPRAQLIVTEPVRVGDDECFVIATPGGNGLEVAYCLDYGPGPIGRQEISLQVTPESFCTELAAARTFILESEAQWLRNQGLCQRAGYADLLVFGEQGPIENRLRFADECVRHKTLDLVGDLALSGCDLIGRFTAQRTGHRQNAELVRELLAQQRSALRKSA